MKRLSKFLIVLLVVSMLVPQITVNAVGTANGVERIFGKDRIETSIKVSKFAYPSGAKTIFIAGFNGDADALTSTSMVGQMNGPLLLTRKAKLEAKLLDEINRLDPENIIILGGESAVGKSVENQLAKKHNTRRIKGNSRVETAVNIALDYYGDRKISEVFVVEYNSLVDALAIGPVSAKVEAPVLITGKDRVPAVVSKFLKDHKVDKVTIVGGKNTVSDKGRAALLKSVEQVDRIYGSNRVQTSLKIAEQYFKDSKTMLVANGYSYADALIGGYFAKMKNAPIILTKKDSINKDALKYILDSKAKPFILGGETVVSKAVYNMVGNLKQEETIKPSPKPTVENISAIEKEVVRLVNIERKKNGLTEFRMDSKLSNVARIKSKDMADKNYFSHTSPTYGSPFEMMKEFGINYRAAAENIAMGQATAEAVVKAWMNSDGHRKNILNPSLNTIGVGAYKSSNKAIYWTQMFTN